MSETKKKVWSWVHLIGGPADGSRHLAPWPDLPAKVTIDGRDCGTYHPTPWYHAGDLVFVHESVKWDRLENE